MNKNSIDRIISKIDFPNDITKCWKFTNNSTSGGYKQLSVNSRTQMAHRVIYALFIEKIPSKLQSDHLCRNRGCVNPTHIEPVSQKINILRGYGPCAINSKKEKCKRGHPFTPDNIITQRSFKPHWRQCKQCEIKRNKERYKKEKQNGSA